MHMINLHAATSLAEDLGLDLVDIYGIRKWKAMQDSPLNDPDIVKYFIRTLPIDEFGEYLKVNRLWYNCCKAELWKRHEEAKAAYNRALEKREKAEDALGQLFGKNGIKNRELRNLEWNMFYKACEEKTKAGIEHIMVDRAFEQFGFRWKYVNWERVYTI